MVEREGPLSLRRQCQLLGLNRDAVCYGPVETGAYELELKSLIDRQYLRTPVLRLTTNDGLAAAARPCG